MKDNVVPPIAPVTTEGSLADLPVRNAAEASGETAFSRKTASGSWNHVSWAEFATDVAAVAKGLIAAGIRPGDRIGLMSRTRYEWTLVDFATWSAGAIVVPIYETSSAEQVEWILSNSGARAVFVENDQHRATVDEARADLSDLTHVFEIEAGVLDTLREQGASVADAEVEARRDGLDRTSVATIIYTSGTTGRPKGCQLTHGNFLDLAENAIQKLGPVILSDNAATLLFLPLAHVFARFIEVLCVAGRARMGHSSDIKTLLDDFATFKPTFILAVPRVFEKIFNSSEAKASSEGKGKIFLRAATVAIAYSEALDTGGPGLLLRLQHAVFDRLVYSKLRAAMGGRVRYAVSGGAPLGTRLGHFYRGIGVLILEGYGLTETTAPVAVNTPDKVKIGTVGYPLPGTGVRIADDGEILLKGVGIFTGYFGNPEATAEAIVDGWFHTGDIGDLDEDGYLRITGRKKEILVTAGGKNVAPAVLEDRLRAHPLVSQCIVVGDQKPFIGALVTLDEEMWPLWAGNHGLDGVSIEEARTHPKVLEALQAAVDRANEAVSKAESIRKFAVLGGDFTEANGYLTPSLKLKRALVMKDFAEDVESLYA
ncbi:long-chain fatty acid--CoA ligase [Intrasporangium oryzae NRRL B-24470]|uniref:Acyl-CoA synthetase n=1 Tax=Intrasporangium oryzae NRRL B-24470 TaxID=1386089 RepID=W9G7Z4_9MICO|nr:AMP-dependent synthetase/ligase [Intrasporangium oryzae]EWS99983.1 long-chain fatty acid--CoA ligase [Intrasporangium oryzae NRRL B-24470]